jgi:hypothetical protein
MSFLELLIYLLAAILYFVPCYIAMYLKINGQKIIFLLNLLLAWTGVAWVLLIIAAISIKNKNNVT